MSVTFHARRAFVLRRALLTASALGAFVLLAACSSALPPNIPRSGTTQPVTMTPIAGATGYPVGTTTPAPGGTAIPAATATATATTATSGGGVPAAATATIAPTIADSGGSGMSGGGLNLGGINLPAQRTPIQFPQGASSFAVNTTLQNNAPQAYQIYVNAGQRMYITTDGNAAIQVYDPNGKAISDVLSAANPVRVTVSQAGNQYIALQGSGPVSMSVYIPPAGANQNVAAPLPGQIQPVQFASGATSASFNANAVAGTPLGYSIQALAGQTMTVTTQGNTTVTLLAPDKTTLVPSKTAPVHQWIFPLAQGGSYTLVVMGSGPVTAKVSIPPAASGGGNSIPQTGSQGTPIPPPANPERVTIATGNASVTVNANLSAGVPKGYVLRVLAGQTLYVETGGPASVTIYGPDGAALVNGSAVFPSRWTASAGQDGDYTFVISGSGTQTLTFFIPPK